jgi:hypothetical protein
MKLHVAFTLALVPSLAFSQSPLPKPESLYQKAFQYIKTDPDFLGLRGPCGCVAVFDSIVHQNQSTFLDELGKQWGYTASYKKEHLLDSLVTLDRLTYHKPYFSRTTASLTSASGSNKGCVVILFSRLHNNLLLAEVSDNGVGGPGLRHVLSTFDQSIMYVFLFGPDGQIQQHYSRRNNYN